MAIKQGIKLIGNFRMKFCLKFWNKKKKCLEHKGNKIASNFAASSVACDREFNFLSNYGSLRTLLKRNNEPSGWHCFFLLPYLFFFRWVLLTFYRTSVDWNLFFRNLPTLSPRSCTCNDVLRDEENRRDSSWGERRKFLLSQKVARRIKFDGCFNSILRCSPIFTRNFFCQIAFH